jgi:tetratricopeptide (TPR) repeat protein
MSRRILLRIFYGLLIAGGIGLILLFGVLSFGLVAGEEFAPDTFDRRSYWYYELPLIRLKITPVTRVTSTHQLEQLLVNSNYIVSQPPPKRWDLVTVTRVGRPWQQGDASILCQYLDAYDPNTKNVVSVWETWTTDHPALAKVLWPEVAALARQDLYFLIPRLFDQALVTDNPQTLQNDLNLILARSYEELAKTEVELQNLETAVRFYSDALRREPARTSCLAGRAQCYEALGRTEEANCDRQQEVPAEAPQ